MLYIIFTMIVFFAAVNKGFKLLSESWNIAAEKFQEVKAAILTLGTTGIIVFGSIIFGI